MYIYIHMYIHGHVPFRRSQKVPRVQHRNVAASGYIIWIYITYLALKTVIVQNWWSSSAQGASPLHAGSPTLYSLFSGLVTLSIYITCIHIYIYIHMYTYIYIYVYIYINRSVLPFPKPGCLLFFLLYSAASHTKNQSASNSFI